MNMIKAIVLAAGKGTRLQTEGIALPKVMRIAAGKPLLGYVLDGLNFLSPEDIVLVVGYQKEAVLAGFPSYPWAEQVEQLGTGHAVQAAMPQLDGFDGHVLVCCGDMPLMKKETYRALVDTHVREGNGCTLLSGISPEILPYGRIVRDDQNHFSAIVEDKDCTAQQRTIRELNAGVYVFQAKALGNALQELRPNNAQGEYYLTDVPGFMLRQGLSVGVCPTCTPEEMLGVNTVEQLEQVERFVLSTEEG